MWTPAAASDRANKKRKQPQPQSGPRLRDRILRLERIPASQLLPNPKNFREHPDEQREAYRTLAEEIGFAGAELVRVLPDGRYMLIDGHLRQEDALAHGDPALPVLVTDLDEQEADALLATYDPISRLATIDSSAASALLDSLRESEHEHLAGILEGVVTQEQRIAELLAQAAESESSLPTHPSSPSSSSPNTPDAWDGTDEGDDSDEDDTTESPNGSAIQYEPIYPQDTILDAAMAYFQETYQETGFPYRNLPVYVSMQRLNQLARTPMERLLRTSIGGDVADTYHPHRFQSTVEGMNSPYQSFHEPKLLRQALKLRYEDAGYLKEGYPTTLNMVNHTQVCSNFRAGFAAYLYRRYCQPGDTVLDTSTGYGGRLVGFLSSEIADPIKHTGRYIGIDPSTQTHAGNVRLATELGFATCVELLNLPAEDVDVDAVGLRERCDFAFTSPPYFAREHYADEATQSSARYPTSAAWRAGFLVPMLRLTYAALKPGARAALNVADVVVHGEDIPLVAWTVEAALSVGFEHEDTLSFPLATSFGLGHDAAAQTSEPVLIFRKPFPSPTHESPAFTPLQKQSQPQSLLAWMRQLYAVCAKEPYLTGDLGVWPQELGEYLRLLCCAHSAMPEAPAEVTLKHSLIFPPESKPLCENTCLLLFSGGKDSLAAGILAEQAGYTVHAVTVLRVNHSYPDEPAHAETLARLMGWKFTTLDPQILPASKGENLSKNQYCLAFALESLDYVPGAYAFGGYAIDDCGISNWFSDFEVAYQQFHEMLETLYAGAGIPCPKRLPPLTDPLDTFKIWRTLPQVIRAEVASCMMPKRNKPQHQRRTRAAGVPLTDYQCGVCYKCYEQSVLLSDVLGLPDDSAPYPETYLKKARRRIAELVQQPLLAHAHLSLESPYVREQGYQDSFTYFTEHVYGGRLPGALVAPESMLAVEPQIKG